MEVLSLSYGLILAKNTIVLSKEVSLLTSDSASI